MVNKFRNLGTVDNLLSPGQHRTTRPPPSSKLPPPFSRARKGPFGIGHRRIRRTILRRIMKEDFIDFIFTRINVFPSWSFAESFSWCACAWWQMGLFGLCWTEAATCSMVGVWWSDVARVTYFYPLSPNYETFWPIYVSTDLLPGASFSCRWFKLKLDRNRLLLLPPNRLRPSFFAIFFKRLDKNPRNFRSEHLRTCPNYHYPDILLSHKYFRHFPLTRNVNFQAADSLSE